MINVYPCPFVCDYYSFYDQIGCINPPSSFTRPILVLRMLGECDKESLCPLLTTEVRVALPCTRLNRMNRWFQQEQILFKHYVCVEHPLCGVDFLSAGYLGTVNPQSHHRVLYHAHLQIQAACALILSGRLFFIK